MFNKKLAIYTVINFAIGYLFLLIVQVATSLEIINTESYILNSIILILSATATIPYIYKSYYVANTSKIRISDIAIPIAFFFILYILYLLPPLNFIGVNGINNSVALIFIFSMGGVYIFNIYFYLKEKYPQKNVRTLKPLDNSKQRRINEIKLVGYLMPALSFIFASINLFVPVIDISFWATDILGG